jgi:hypothetical protein
LHLIVCKLILRARYATVILNPSKNPHRKEVVAEISACILKKHAEGRNPAKYWDRKEQETKLTPTFKKWACEGTVWSAGARKVSNLSQKSLFHTNINFRFMRNSSNMYRKAALNASGRTYKQMEAAWRGRTKGGTPSSMYTPAGL